MTDIELERIKMYQDSFKHLTTFSSGGILLASAVTGALFPKPALVWVLAISISLLALGALFAMLGLGSVPRYIDLLARDGSREPPTLMRDWLRYSMVAAYFGMGSFSFFAVYNLVP